MHITRIVLNNNMIYSDYDIMVLDKLQYWDRENPEVARYLRKHQEFIDASEETLEKIHGLDKGMLRGAHLIYGSITDMRKALDNAELRSIIKSNQAEFLVNIGTRHVEVKMHHYAQNNTRNIANYQIEHNFFNMPRIRNPEKRPS